MEKRRYNYTLCSCCCSESIYWSARCFNFVLNLDIKKQSHWNWQGPLKYVTKLVTVSSDTPSKNIVCRMWVSIFILNPQQNYMYIINILKFSYSSTIKYATIEFFQAYISFSFSCVRLSSFCSSNLMLTSYNQRGFVRSQKVKEIE